MLIWIYNYKCRRFAMYHRYHPNILNMNLILRMNYIVYQEDFFSFVMYYSLVFDDRIIVYLLMAQQHLWPY